MKTKEMKNASLSEVLEFGKGENYLSGVPKRVTYFFADEEIILLVCQTL